ncbi:hypothetical protein KEM52_006420 [Ascosphaera acerosa]|nr:hypothetical protein KEM52_006420 [Ascosphaera acerosa]
MPCDRVIGGSSCTGFLPLGCLMGPTLRSARARCRQQTQAVVPKAERKEHTGEHRPDYTDTEPAATFKRCPAWGDPAKIVAMDPFGHIAPWVYADLIAREDVDIRPTIAITKAHMKLPEMEATVSAGRLKPDGKICLNEKGELAVTKIAVEPVWFLPGVAGRLKIADMGYRPAPLPVMTDEETLRRSLFELTGGSYPELITRPDIKLFLPPIGGLTVYIFGDPDKVSDPAARLALRVHDECNGSDVFGSDICTCRPYLIFGVEEAVKEAQNGGSGVVIYFRKEGRALGEVTKYLVYNARKRSQDRASEYFKRTENIAGVKDMRFQALMPDILHWLGITKIDRMLSMSNMKHDAIVDQGIQILERVPIPDELIPEDSRVEIDAKIHAGYFTTGKVMNDEELAAVQGRAWDDIDVSLVPLLIERDLLDIPALTITAGNKETTADHASHRPAAATMLEGLHTAWNCADPRAALRLSQQAPAFLAAQPATAPAFPASMFQKGETAELWLSYERLFLACLRTGDDESARECLHRLTERFGARNERVMGLHGLWEEARAEGKSGLMKVLLSYDEVLEKNPVNVPIAKRRIALLRSLGRSEEAAKALTELLGGFPTDGEAWVELSDLYRSLGLFPQAVFSLQEALLISPNAWNLHARLGELEYISATGPTRDAGADSASDAALIGLATSIRHFCRSVELCDDYIRGYFGLKLSTAKLLELLPPPAKLSSAVKNENVVQSRETLQQLNALATAKLREIVAARGEAQADGAGGAGEEAEAALIAAQQLLDRDGTAAAERM